MSEEKSFEEVVQEILSNFKDDNFKEEEFTKLAKIVYLVLTREEEVNAFIETTGWSREDFEDACEKYIKTFFPELADIII